MFLISYISKFYKTGFLCGLMLTIFSSSTGQNIGLYGAGYLSSNDKYESGTGAGLYFHNYLNDSFDLGIDIHILQNTENKENWVSYCNGEPCSGRFVSDNDIDSTVTYSAKLTHYIWKFSLEPTWQLINEKEEPSYMLALGLDFGIGKVGRKEFLKSGYQYGYLFKPIERFNISLGLTLNTQFRNFPSKKLNLFFKINPEFYFTKGPQVEDGTRFMTKNMSTSQAKIGILYSFDGS